MFENDKFRNIAGDLYKSECENFAKWANLSVPTLVSTKTAINEIVFELYNKPALTKMLNVWAEFIMSISAATEKDEILEIFTVNYDSALEDVAIRMNPKEGLISIDTGRTHDV